MFCHFYAWQTSVHMNLIRMCVNMCIYVYICIAYTNCENKTQSIYVFQTAMRKPAT